MQSLSPTHDLDGNLKPNRLIKVLRADATSISYAYDALSRRISVHQHGTQPNDQSLISSNYYLSDGWNPVAEYAGTTLEKTYTWEMDLSGSLQGAGGLLALANRMIDLLNNQVQKVVCDDSEYVPVIDVPK